MSIFGHFSKMAITPPKTNKNAFLEVDSKSAKALLQNKVKKSKI